MSESGVRAPKRRYARGVASRDEIIVAATSLFSEVGFYETSLRAIAVKVGMTHPGLLHHFANKDDLLMAVLDYRDRADQKWLEENFTLTEFVSGEAIARLLERNMSLPGAIGLFTKLSAEATNPEHPAHAYFVQRYEWICGIYADGVRQAQGVGLFKKSVDPSDTACAFVALLDGMQLQWLLGGREAQETLTKMARIVDKFIEPLRA